MIPGAATAPAAAFPSGPADTRFHARLRMYFRNAFAGYAVLLVLSVYSQTNDPAEDIKRLITAWFAAAAVVAWAVASWRFGLPFRRPRILHGLLAVFIGWYLLAVTHSSARVLSLHECADFILLAALYFVASQIYTSPADARRLLRALCIAVAIASCYGLFLQKTGVDPFPWADRDSDVYRQLPATFGNPNFAAHTLILTICMCLYLAATGAPVFLLLALLQAAHLYFTHQRGGLVALCGAAALVAIAWVIGRRLRRPMAGAVTSIVLVFVLAFAGLLGVMAMTRIMTRTPFPMETSLLIRYQSYVSATDMLRVAPVFGWGPGVYKREYPIYWTPFEKEWFAQENRKNDHVHNDPIELAIDAGLPASGMYIALLALGTLFSLALALSSGPRDRRRIGYMLAAIFLAFFIDGCFGFNLRVPVSAVILFLMLGVLDGIYATPAPLPRRGLLRTFFATTLLILAIVQSRQFVSQYQLLQGRAAERRAQIARDTGNAANVKTALGEAAGHFRRGEALAPWDAQFAWWLGRIALNMGDPNEAVKHFQRSLDVNPHAILKHLPLAQAKLQIAQRYMAAHRDEVDTALGMLDDAAAHARAILALCPDYARAEALLGEVAAVSAIFIGAAQPDAKQRIAGYWHTAEDHLERAVRLGLPEEDSLYRMLAKVRVALDKPLLAEAALTKAALADPRDTETWTLYVNFAHANKRHDRLRNTLYAKLKSLENEKSPDTDTMATLRLTLANVLENGYKDLDGADDAYLRAISLAPQRPEIWTNFARYAFAHDRMPTLRRAVAQSTAALQLANAKPLAHVAAVNAVLQSGAKALNAASAALVEQVRAYPPNAVLSPMQMYGWAARMMSSELPAQPTAEQCEGYLNLGIVWSSLDDHDVAEQLFQRAEPCLSPQRQAFLDVHWADLLVRQGKIQDALLRLEKGQDADISNLDVRWAIARTLAKLGRTDDARKAYDALLEEKVLPKQAHEMLQRERTRLDTPAAK